MRRKEASRYREVAELIRFYRAICGKEVGFRFSDYVKRH